MYIAFLMVLVKPCGPLSTMEKMSYVILKLLGILWNRTLVEFVDKLSSTAADFIRSERELENVCLYGA